MSSHGRIFTVTSLRQDLKDGPPRNFRIIIEDDTRMEISNVDEDIVANELF